jgi:ferric-dicitrate binding protein FerR (iron transport regulator)
MERAEDISILITDKDFQKVLSGWAGYSVEEKAEVFKEYGLTKKEFEILQQLWFGLDFKFPERPSAITEEALDETIWKLAEKGNPGVPKTPVRRIYEQFAKIAAILIIPVMLYTAYVQLFEGNGASPETAQLITVNSQPGTITNMALPDGTKVYLNSGSSVTYPSHFSGGTREISLSGEAYFEVVKDKKIPMKVSAGNVVLKVYGTSFNVNAFPAEEFVKVTLVEGSVSISSPLGKFKGKDEFFIEPSQTITFYDGSRKLLMENEDPFQFTAWKDGLLVFKNTSFESVLKQLSRKFNIEIELKDQNLASIPMDATFRSENINEILRLLSLGTPFKYHYRATQKLQDASFAKSKIYIEENKD